MVLKYLLPLVVLGSMGCTSQPDVARYTVEEYRANEDLRKEVFAKCVNDPGTLGQTPDCINAREAERQESRGSLRNSPPVGLYPDSRR